MSFPSFTVERILVAPQYPDNFIAFGDQEMTTVEWILAFASTDDEFFRDNRSGVDFFAYRLIVDQKPYWLTFTQHQQYGITFLIVEDLGNSRNNKPIYKGNTTESSLPMPGQALKAIVGFVDNYDRSYVGTKDGLVTKKGPYNAIEFSHPW